MGAEVLEAEFARLRGPLLVHCYQMVGSYDEAEDLVQDVYLRARRGLDGFEGRSSLKTWLYRIATNACLTALHSRNRRVLPSGLGAPSNDPDTPTPPDPSVSWLQPLPDAAWSDPGETVVRRESVRIALVSMLQNLAPRQRAVFLLREVLDWPAADVAVTLDLNVTAVKSLLQRARVRLKELGHEPPPQPGEHDEELLARYIKAFETSDVKAIERLIHEDFRLEVAASRTWFKGIATCLPYLQRYALGRPGDWRMQPTRVNGQPAAASYHLGDDGRYAAFCLCVFEIADGTIRGVTLFDGARAFAAAGFPLSLT
ncbi:RNA polymerase subunit sigma-70 [Kribbella sp. NPDC020789]